MFSLQPILTLKSLLCWSWNLNQLKCAVCEYSWKLHIYSCCKSTLHVSLLCKCSVIYQNARLIFKLFYIISDIFILHHCLTSLLYLPVFELTVWLRVAVFKDLPSSHAVQYCFPHSECLWWRFFCWYAFNWSRTSLKCVENRHASE